MKLSLQYILLHPIEFRLVPVFKINARLLMAESCPRPQAPKIFIEKSDPPPPILGGPSILGTFQFE